MTQQRSVTITPVPAWGVGQARIEVDGHDISTAVRGVDVRMRAGELPIVDLDLMVYEVKRLDMAEAEVVIDSDVRDALIKLGWTPPKETL